MLYFCADLIIYTKIQKVMKKILLKLLCMSMLCFFSVSLISCESDDDEPGVKNTTTKPTGENLVEALQGTWALEKIKVKCLGQTFEYDLDDLKTQSGNTVFYDDVLTFDGEKVNGLNYSIDGNNILLPWYDDTWWAEVSFLGTQMTLYYNINYEGVKMEEWAIYSKSNSSSRSSNISNTNSINSIIPIAIKATKM